MKMITVLLLTMALLFPYSLLASDKNINLKPISVNEKKFPVIGIAKIDSTVSGDAIIGRHRRDEDTMLFGSNGGLVAGSQSKTKNLSGNQIFNEQILKDYKKSMCEELVSAGYGISSSAAPSLFEEAKETDNSRFQIGAIISKCNVRTIQDAFDNDVTECHMEEIEWQLFDRDSKKVFFTTKTSGWDKKRGTVVQNAASAAFRKAFRNLLAQGEMVKAIEKVLSGK